MMAARPAVSARRVLALSATGLAAARFRLAVLMAAAACLGALAGADGSAIEAGFWYLSDPRGVLTVILYAASAALGVVSLAEDRARAEWLALPASPAEKFLSTVLCWCLIVPAALFSLQVAGSLLAGEDSLRASLPGAGPDSPILRAVLSASWGIPVAVPICMSGFVFRKNPVPAAVFCLLALPMAGTLICAALAGSPSLRELRLDPSWNPLDWSLLLWMPVLEASARTQGERIAMAFHEWKSLSALVVSWLALPALSLGLGWIGLRRMEADHA